MGLSQAGEAPNPIYCPGFGQRDTSPRLFPRTPGSAVRGLGGKEPRVRRRELSTAQLRLYQAALLQIQGSGGRERRRERELKHQLKCQDDL
jgi:hypothetical protein